MIPPEVPGLPLLRVHGDDNLYVADASVFPFGITVNPQWTIMALASHIASRVIARHG